MADMDDVVRELQEIRKVLQDDRVQMWRVMTILIIGAFALVGIKLIFP